MVARQISRSRDVQVWSTRWAVLVLIVGRVWRRRGITSRSQPIFRIAAYAAATQGRGGGIEVGVVESSLEYGCCQAVSGSPNWQI